MDISDARKLSIAFLVLVAYIFAISWFVYWLTGFSAALAWLETGGIPAGNLRLSCAIFVAFCLGWQLVEETVKTVHAVREEEYRRNSLPYIFPPIGLVGVVLLEIGVRLTSFF